MKCLMVLGILILLAGCEIEERGEPIEVYASESDNLDEVLELFLGGTKSELHCALYSFDDHFEKVLDGMDANTSLKITGNIELQHQWYRQRERRVMHSKFCVRDGEAVLFGSFNPSIDRSTLNNIIIIHSKHAAGIFETEFDELWNGARDAETKKNVWKYNDGEIMVNFCPDDSCKEILLNEIGNAKNSIQFALFSFTLPEVLDLVRDKQLEGLDVKGRVEDRRMNMQYELLDDLVDVGAEPDERSTLLHHKLWIVDNETLLTGSMNPTNNGVKGNDEVFVVIRDKDVASRMGQRLLK